MLDYLREELLATVAAYTIHHPSDARKWCLTSRTFASAFEQFSLWPLVVANIRWPPSAHRDRVLCAYSRLGCHCMRLSVDEVRAGSQDILCLAQCCPSVRALEVTGIGAKGLDPTIWKLWSALNSANLSFFYDAVDGPPALREVIADVVRQCNELEQLTVAGMDWKNARQSCVTRLCVGGLPKLRRLVLAGCEALLTPEEQQQLSTARPDLSVFSVVKRLPNLDW